MQNDYNDDDPVPWRLSPRRDPMGGPVARFDRFCPLPATLRSRHVPVSDSREPNDACTLASGRRRALSAVKRLVANGQRQRVHIEARCFSTACYGFVVWLLRLQNYSIRWTTVNLICLQRKICLGQSSSCVNRRRSVSVKAAFNASLARFKRSYGKFQR